MQLEINVPSIFNVYELNIVDIDFLDLYDINIIQSITVNGESYDVRYNEELELIDIQDSYGYSLWEIGYECNNLIPETTRDISHIIKKTYDWDYLSEIIYYLEESETKNCKLEVEFWNDDELNYESKKVDCKIKHIETWIYINEI